MLTFLAAAPRRTQSSWFLRAFAHFGGLGLVPLAVLDSSIIPTFGSLDILAAFLAARHADVWPYYAAMATIGAMIGAYITYKIGQRTGRGWMERRVGAHRSRQVAYILERWGFGAIFVSTVAPPPCPTALFFLAAGAFDYHMKKFMTAVFTGRAIRYTLLTLVSAIYGRRILRYVRHPQQFLLPSLLLTLLILGMVCVFILLGKTPELAAETAASAVPSEKA